MAGLGFMVGLGGEVVAMPLPMYEKIMAAAVARAEVLAFLRGCVGAWSEEVIAFCEKELAKMASGYGCHVAMKECA